MNPNKILTRRYTPTLRHVSLVCGLLVLVGCIAVPLPSLDLDTPFTAAMVRHVGLLLIAAPLLAMAIPSDNGMRKPLTSLSRLTAHHPAIAWVAGILTMWLWHLPIFYNLPASAGGILSCSPFLPAHGSPALAAHAAAAALPASFATISLPATITRIIPLIHTPSLLLAGFIFCWPLVTPYPSLRLPAMHSILYLASACVACSLAGLLITYAPQGMYRGVTIHDQQSGGLIMCVPCCFLYLTATMTLLIRWLSLKEPVKLIHS